MRKSDKQGQICTPATSDADSANGIEYDSTKYGNAFGRHLYDREAATFASLLSGVHGSILDVGVGTGKLSVSLVHESRRVVAIDSSLDMIRAARSKAVRTNEIIPSFVLCDAQRLCFRDDVFDAIVSSRVLMHLPDWRRGISELCRATQGEVVIDFPSMWSFSGLDPIFKRVQKFFSSELETYRTLSRGGVVREFEKHGLQVLSLEKRFFLPYAFHRWLDNPGISIRLEGACRRLGLVSVFGCSVTVKARKRDRRPMSETRCAI